MANYFRRIRRHVTRIHTDTHTQRHTYKGKKNIKGSNGGVVNGVENMQVQKQRDCKLELRSTGREQRTPATAHQGPLIQLFPICYLCLVRIPLFQDKGKTIS